MAAASGPLHRAVQAAAEKVDRVVATLLKEQAAAKAGNAELALPEDVVEEAAVAARVPDLEWALSAARAATPLSPNLLWPAR